MKFLRLLMSRVNMRFILLIKSLTPTALVILLGKEDKARDKKEKPKGTAKISKSYIIDQCKKNDSNYAARLSIRIRLRNKVDNKVTDETAYVGEFPIMTDQGTFIINGAERVVINQIVRSPGAYYGESRSKMGNRLLSAELIPYRVHGFSSKRMRRRQSLRPKRSLLLATRQPTSPKNTTLCILSWTSLTRFHFLYS